MATMDIHGELKRLLWIYHDPTAQDVEYEDEFDELCARCKGKLLVDPPAQGPSRTEYDAIDFCPGCGKARHLHDSMWCRYGCGVWLCSKCAAAKKHTCKYSATHQPEPAAADEVCATMNQTMAILHCGRCGHNLEPLDAPPQTRRCPKCELEVVIELEHAARVGGTNCVFCQLKDAAIHRGADYIRSMLSAPAPSDAERNAAMDASENRINAERDQYRAALSIIPTDRLRKLAEWIDAWDNQRLYDGPREVQEDLRALAAAMDDLGLKPDPQPLTFAETDWLTATTAMVCDNAVIAPKSDPNRRYQVIGGDVIRWDNVSDPHGRRTRIGIIEVYAYMNEPWLIYSETNQ